MNSLSEAEAYKIKNHTKSYSPGTLRYVATCIPFEGHITESLMNQVMHHVINCACDAWWEW